MNALTSATGGPDDNDAQAGHLVYVKSARSGAPAADGSLPPETWIEGGVSPTLNTFDNGDVRATVLAFAWQAGDNNDAPGAFNDDGTTPTLPKSQTLAIQETAGGVRRLTPVECERLQGFPDDWTAVRDTDTPQADSSRYRQLGNAVAVPVAQWILARIAEAS